MSTQDGLNSLIVQYQTLGGTIQLVGSAMKKSLLVLAVIFVPLALFAQNSMPSNEELSELLSKAAQKVTGFEEAALNAKPYLDQQDSKLMANYMDTAKTARDVINIAQKEGASAYRLVTLLSLLDDLTVDAANAAARLSQAECRTAVVRANPGTFDGRSHFIRRAPLTASLRLHDAHRGY